jgi:hypothetical protein
MEMDKKGHIAALITIMITIISLAWTCMIKKNARLFGGSFV